MDPTKSEDPNLEHDQVKDDREPLAGYENIQDQNENSQRKPELRRFYILIVFGLLNFTQAGVWNTWGSISASAEYAFGWEDSTIALLSNWGPITYIISTAFFAWLADEKGFRISMLLTAVVVALGCGLRCITSTPPASTWLIHAGQFFNGLGGPILMGGPPLLSALWFPVHERTKSTAFGSMCAGWGIAVSYIIAPLLVPDVSQHVGAGGHLSNDSNHTIPSVKEVRESIMFLMYIEFAFAALLLLLIMIHYPSKPNTAPSVSATIQRVAFKSALLKLFRNKKFWMLSVPYSLAGGVSGGWGSVFYVMLKPNHVSQETAGWVGFWTAVSSMVSSMLLGIFADKFARRMKAMIISLYIVSAVANLIFALMYVGTFEFTIVALYVTNIIAGSSLGATGPLMYELICESTFPIAEGITNIFNTCLNNIAVLIFLFIPFITTGTAWMNWLLVASIAVCIPIFAIFPESYTRFDIDTDKEPDIVDADHRPIDDASS